MDTVSALISLYRLRALLEGICATLNSHIEALTLFNYYYVEGCYFGTIMRSVYIGKIQCLQKIQILQ